VFDDLLTMHEPPPNRAQHCAGGREHHLTEGAVMIAFAMHLLRTVPDLKHVAIHPDGEHGKRFDFKNWLGSHGFSMTKPMGSTAYGGLYSSAAAGQTLLINPKSGLGDVVADISGRSFVAECKGGTINSKHAGQVSRLRKGLCETVGLSLAVPIAPGKRQFAVVPHTPATEHLAKKMIVRARSAGVEIALVNGRGAVFCDQMTPPLKNSLTAIA
jgi:hypothetical protein